MIVFITGASHTGKTALAQKLLAQYQYPYFSIDHLKMGLIRSGYTHLTPEDDAELIDYLWPILREMAKTAIENHQNLIIEGSYLPFDWKKDFTEEYLPHIQYYCLVMSEHYIRNHFQDIKTYANIMEKRMDDDWCTMEHVLKKTQSFLPLPKSMMQISYSLMTSMKSTWIYGNAADALGSKRIVRNVFAQCKEIPCLLCYDEKKTSNDIDIKRGDMMDFPSRFFLFLLSTGVFFALALMIPLTSGMLLILPPLLALASTALVSHIFSQKKRMDALEKEVAELKEKMENLKPTEISEGK